MFKIISGKKYKEMIEAKNKLVKNNIELTLDLQDKENDIEIYLEQVQYLQNEVSKLRKKYEKKTKKVVKKEKKVEEKPKKRVGRPKKEQK